MADLDDFFAKKDRSKKKNVKKFTTADEIAKKLEDPKQKTEVRKKERPAQDGEDSGRAGEEEEWKEYEEPVKDYTGLKIQVLQGGAGAPDAGRDPGAEDCGPGEGGKVKGPWNKPQAEVDQPAAPPPEEEPAKPAKPAERKPAAYVAPAARARPVEVPLRRNQQKHAPDIHNDDYFPQLGAAAKRGAVTGWSSPAPPSTAPRAQTNKPLALDNRFTSLQDS